MIKRFSHKVCLLTLISIFVGFFSASSQLSYFKNLNTLDAGSKPTNFIKLDQEVYFVSEGGFGFELWRYSSNGLTKAFDDNIIYNQYSNETMVQQSGEYIYFYKYQYNINNLYDLYRTKNGITELMVEKIPQGRIITVVDKLFLESLAGIFEIKNHQLLDRFTFNLHSGTNLYYSNNFSSYYKAFSLNDNLFFFHFEIDNQNTYKLRVLHLNHGGNVTVMDSLQGLIFNGNNIIDEPLIHKDKLFFAASKLNNASYNVETSFYKFDGDNIFKVKKIGELPLSIFFSTFNTSYIQSLTKSGNDLAFIYNSKELWLSNGDSTGTFKVQTFDEVPQYEYGKKIPSTLISYNNNLYFAAKSNNEIELWKSDGSSGGTQLVKDIYPSESAYPHNFNIIKNQLFFRTAKDEIWQTDGTNSGTFLIKTIPREPDYIFRLSEKPNFSAINFTNVIYSKYDTAVGYEPFLFDFSTNTETLIQNLNSLKQTQIYSNVKVQMDSVWYFNGISELGAELWRTDGTMAGTYLVKDLNIGSEGSVFKEMIASDSLIFFIIRFANSKMDKLYKSDGTSEGTIEINVNPNNESIFSLSQLAVSDNALYVKRSSILTADLLKIKGNFQSVLTNTFNWTNLSTLAFSDSLLICPSRPYLSIIWPDTIIRLSNFVLNNYDIFYSKLGNNIVLFDLANLYLSNGTNEGTTLIKKTHIDTFHQPDRFLNMYSTGKEVYLFLLDLKTNVPILKVWRTDGTADGTYIVVEIPIEGLVQGTFKVTHTNSLVLFSIEKVNLKNEFYIIKDNKVSLLIKSENSSISLSEFVVLNNKIYFTYNRNDIGTELYVTDGTQEGTFLVEEIEKGTLSSKIQYLMPFKNNLIFQGFDHNLGYGLYQYVPLLCEGNRNYAIKSGDWTDAENWSCGHVPNLSEYAIINPPYKIISTDSEIINTKQLLVNYGGGLLFENGAVKMVNPR